MNLNQSKKSKSSWNLSSSLGSLGTTEQRPSVSYKICNSHLGSDAMIFIRLSTTSLDNVWRHAFLIALIIKSVWTTIDVNLPEMQYIADHLTHEECRKLVAALHDPGYDLSKHIDLAERKVPEETPCLNMLLHWNSAQDEGKGETHSMLSHRLIQIKRRDLARWLSNTTFHELSQNLDDTLLSDPFKDIVKSESVNIYRNTRNASNCVDSMKKQCDENDYIWNIMDTIGFTLIILTALATLVILARLLCLYGVRCWKPDEEEVPSQNVTARRSNSNTEKQKKSTDKKKNKSSLLCKTVEFRNDGTKEETEVLLTDASESDFDKVLKELNMQSRCNFKYIDEGKKKSRHSVEEESESEKT